MPRLLTLLAAALLLSACGHGSPAAPTQPIALGPRLAPPPLPTAAVAPTDPAVQQRVQAAIDRLDKVSTLVGKVVFDESKDPGHVDHGEAKFTFRHKPFAARVDVQQSTRWFASGAAILWNGGATLRIKAAHVPISVEFGYDNAQVVSVRGYRIDQTDIFSMGKVLRAPGAVIKGMGTRRIHNEDLYLVDVTSPASLPGITHEIIGLSAKILIPTYREMYAGSAVVHKGQGLGVTLDSSIPASDFEL
ncbi:MAG: hypothetical protein JWM80_5804 [Cyanobacteria bacterium RYN_339]|nr:hypothetical protein [Cyanobacteria bacterium RYN_339]